MAEINSIVVWSFIGAAIGMLIAYGISEEKKVPEIITISLLTAILMGSMQMNYIMHERIHSVDLIVSSVLNGNNCQRKIDGHNNRIFKEIANHFYSKADGMCNQLQTFTVKLTPEEVKQVWNIMLENAEHTFQATNTIAPKDWPAASCENQRTSKVRNISRVMIHRKNADLHNKSLDELAKKQLKDCGVQSVSYYLRDELYKNYRALLEDIGTLDIVLVDNSVLLLTNYDEEEMIILNGSVTVDTNLITKTRQFFNSLESKATPYALTSN